MLEIERAYFAQSLPEWLKLYPGKVALVKGQELISTYDNETHAVSEGAKRFGNTSFLVRRISPSAVEFSVPALTLGIPLTRADSELIDGRPAHIA